MRKILVLSFIFFCLFFYGLILSQTNIAVIKEDLKPTNYTGWYDYRGVMNVHTTRGIGSGRVAQVIKAAQDVGLDFLFITDLNIFDLPKIQDGYHRQTLVLNGGSYSYLDSRLLVYEYKRRLAMETLGQAQVQMADLLSQSGKDADQDLLIIAHPTKPGFTWKGAYPTGLDGLEVVNLKSVWQHAWNNSKLSFLWSAIIFPFNPDLALFRLYEEPEEELALWDQLSQDRHTIGMLGTDATARTGSIENFHFKFPRYQTSFSLASNHVLLRSELTGEVDSDREKIVGALARGNSYIGLDVLGSPKGFVAYLQDIEGNHYPMGSKLKWKPGMKIVVHLPKKPRVPFEAAFLKDGQHIMSSNSVDTEYEIHGHGVYRVVIRVFLPLTILDGQRWVTWIYTNPFFINAL